MRILLSFFIIAAVAGLALAASPAAGSWNVTTTGPNEGDIFQWTLTLKETDGKLSGNLTGDMGDLPLIDPQCSDSHLTFQVALDLNKYAVDVKVDADKLDGGWKGLDTGDSGTVKGARQP